ncbi:hypothetical protein C465_11823 [Halorubrum distributum JCM 9100]|uniref:Uncharacterized protein n=2 Tax=Halorubrum distributum TaxID=29283 RepID=M0EJ30_9EURY|nr:hypothetical protein [Halorubrum distributum]ELZ47048.1 hypothetical protein C465_11823 [Halorubrum distributum JCM 9100]ELZ55612.1 hypothetical protein C466_05273 [Halorubrum distributum JCM 10118]
MSPIVSPPLDGSVSIVASVVAAGGVPPVDPAALPLTAGGLVVAGAFVGGGLLLIGGIVALAYRSGDERVDRVADALDGDLPTPTDAPVREGADVPSAANLHEVAEREDGDPVYVPVIRIPLATADPGRDGVYRHAARAATALHDEFEDAHVRGYDVEFGLDDGSLGGVGRTVKRVAVTPEIAARLRDRDYDHRDLREDVADGDDGDPGVPPVDWGDAVSYATGDGSAATAGAAATTAAT